MLCVRFPKLFALDCRKYCWVADRVRQADGAVQFAWQWARRPRSMEELQELAQISTLLQEVEFSVGPDRWSWMAGAGGVFSVRGVKEQVVEVRCGSRVQEFTWCNWVPLKVAFVAWRASLDRLPTRENLARRGVQLRTSYCPFCDAEVESVDHVLFACRVSQEVWGLIGGWCRQGPIFAAEIKDLLSIPDYARGSNRFKKVVRAIFLVTIWCIWKARNEIVFNNGRVVVAKIVEEVKVLSFLWVDNRNRRGKLGWEHWRAFDIVPYV